MAIYNGYGNEVRLTAAYLVTGSLLVTYRERGVRGEVATEARFLAADGGALEIERAIYGINPTLFREEYRVIVPPSSN